MAKGEVSVSFKCKRCGGTMIELPDNATDASTAKCKKCQSSLGRWGDIKKGAQQIAADHVKGLLANALKGMKGFKRR